MLALGSNADDVGSTYTLRTKVVQQGAADELAKVRWGSCSAGCVGAVRIGVRQAERGRYSSIREGAQAAAASVAQPGFRQAEASAVLLLHLQRAGKQR